MKYTFRPLRKAPRLLKLAVIHSAHALHIYASEPARGQTNVPAPGLGRPWQGAAWRLLAVEILVTLKHLFGGHRFWL